MSTRTTITKGRDRQGRQYAVRKHHVGGRLSIVQWWRVNARADDGRIISDTAVAVNAATGHYTRREGASS